MRDPQSRQKIRKRDAAGRMADNHIHIYEMPLENSEVISKHASAHHSSNGINLLLPPPFPSSPHYFLQPNIAHPNPTLFLPPQIPPTKRLRPPLRLLLLPQPLQLLRIQSRIASLRPIHALLARHVSHAAEDAAGGEGAADAFGDAALDGVDVFVAGKVSGELIYRGEGVSGGGGRKGRVWGEEGEGEGREWGGYLWLCRRFCSRPSIPGLCLRSRACSLCRLRCTFSSSIRS